MLFLFLFPDSIELSRCEKLFAKSLAIFKSFSRCRYMSIETYALPSMIKTSPAFIMSFIYAPPLASL